MLLSTPNVKVLTVPGEQMADDEALMAELRAHLDPPVQPAHGVLGIVRRVKNGRLVVHVLNYAGRASGPERAPTGRPKCGYLYRAL